MCAHLSHVCAPLKHERSAYLSQTPHFLLLVLSLSFLFSCIHTHPNHLLYHAHPHLYVQITYYTTPTHTYTDPFLSLSRLQMGKMLTKGDKRPLKPWEDVTAGFIAGALMQIFFLKKKKCIWFGVHHIYMTHRIVYINDWCVYMDVCPWSWRASHTHDTHDIHMTHMTYTWHTWHRHDI